MDSAYSVSDAVTRPCSSRIRLDARPRPRRVTTITDMAGLGSLGAWLGLIGVVTGAAITTGATWLQNRHRDRLEQQRELQAAIGQVTASATSIVLLVGWYHGARNIPQNSSLRNTMGDESEWVEKITNAVERLHVADQVIQRYGHDSLASASADLVFMSTEYARGRSNTSDSVNEAITSFKKAWSKKAVEGPMPGQREL